MRFHNHTCWRNTDLERLIQACAEALGIEIDPDLLVLVECGNFCAGFDKESGRLYVRLGAAHATPLQVIVSNRQVAVGDFKRLVRCLAIGLVDMSKRRTTKPTRNKSRPVVLPVVSGVIGLDLPFWRVEKDSPEWHAQRVIHLTDDVAAASTDIERIRTWLAENPDPDFLSGVLCELQKTESRRKRLMGLLEKSMKLNAQAVWSS